jgi:hypothetical protein
MKTKKKKATRRSNCFARRKPVRKIRVTAERVLKTLKVPEGFTTEILDGSRCSEYALSPNWRADKYDAGYKTLVFRNEALNIILLVVVREGLQFIDELMSGHTLYKEGTMWLSYDRTGVEDSFYIAHPEYAKTRTWHKEPPGGELNHQVNRVLDQRKRVSEGGGWVSIPEIGFRVLASNVAEMKAEFKRTGHKSFTPSGFGTGYHLSLRPSSRYAKISPKLAEFFEVPAVWVSTMDCD